MYLIKSILELSGNVIYFCVLTQERHSLILLFLSDFCKYHFQEAISSHNALIADDNYLENKKKPHAGGTYFIFTILACLFECIYEPAIA